MVCTKSIGFKISKFKLPFSTEQTTTYNDNDSEWEQRSLNSECEEEKTEFSAEVKPFMISLCKVEGESIEEEDSVKEDDHSTDSSFKCYQHRSKPKDDNVGGGR